MNREIVKYKISNILVQRLRHTLVILYQRTYCYVNDVLCDYHYMLKYCCFFFCLFVIFVIVFIADFCPGEKEFLCTLFTAACWQWSDGSLGAKWIN